MDTKHRVNARPYSPGVYASGHDLFAAALESPRVRSSIESSRAVLAGIRQERETMTKDERDRVNVAPAPQPRPWYRRAVPLLAVGVGVAGTLLACTALAVAGTGREDPDASGPAPAASASASSVGSSAAPASGTAWVGKPAVYLLEVTGPGRAQVTYSVGGSTSSVGNVKLPWRREVSEAEDYVGVTVFVDRATDAKPFRCKITHRDADGALEVVSEGSSEPGEFVTVSCDRFSF